MMFRAKLPSLDLLERSFCAQGIVEDHELLGYCCNLGDGLLRQKNPFSLSST